MKLDKIIKENRIDRKKVKEAAVNAAGDIFKEPDMKKINGIVSAAISQSDSTAAAIQIAINMMRSDNRKQD